MIPLHVGSLVFVSKKELVRIFDPKPAIYTCKLAVLIFGPTIHQKFNENGDPLQHLEPKKLQSLISQYQYSKQKISCHDK